jgi:hypothetical protein
MRAVFPWPGGPKERDCQVEQRLSAFQAAGLLGHAHHPTTPLRTNRLEQLLFKRICSVQTDGPGLRRADARLRQSFVHQAG